MILFTKPDCQKCVWLKENVDLTGVEIAELTPENSDALSDLAWYELVNVDLPILLDEKNMSYLSGAIRIKKFLEGL